MLYPICRQISQGRDAVQPVCQVSPARCGEFLDLGVFLLGNFGPSRSRA